MAAYSMKLKIGQIAPDIKLPDQLGKIHQLSDYRGSWVLVYFYPKDDTPGCVKEACSIRDNLPDFSKLKTVILGISADNIKSHGKFAEKYQLPFTLLADEKKEVIKKYDVWGRKKFMGRSYLGIKRASFLINPAGKISKIYAEVKPDKHVEEVLSNLKTLARQTTK